MLVWLFRRAVVVCCCLLFVPGWVLCCFFWLVGCLFGWVIWVVLPTFWGVVCVISARLTFLFSVGGVWLICAVLWFCCVDRLFVPVGLGGFVCLLV